MIVFISANCNVIISSRWTEFEIVKQNFHVEGNDAALDGGQLKEGVNVTLTCQTSRAYEYCTWKHNNKECTFEWKRVTNL